MNFDNFFRSKSYGNLFKALSVLLAILIIFSAGLFVGYRKAEFSYHWSNNYYRDFGGPHSPFGMMSGGDDATPNPHGAFGTVVSVNLPSIAVKGPREAEKVIIIGPRTIVHLLRNLATSSDIHAGQSIIVVGEPDEQGQIQASFIRILPPPPDKLSASSTKIY